MTTFGTPGYDFIETPEGRIGDFSFVPVAERRDRKVAAEQRPVQPEDLALARQETPDATRTLLGAQQG